MMIKVYTQKTCGQCRAVKMLLDKKGIEYEVVDVNDDNMNDMKSQGIIHTPTLDIDGQKYVGKPMMDKIKEL